MTCDFIISSATQAFGAVQWFCFTMTFGFFLSYCMVWDQDWWFYLNHRTAAINQKFVIILASALACANSFAAWRMWFCNDWDAYPYTLAFYVAMILASMLWPIFINVIKASSIPAIIVSLIAAGCAITFAIFAFFIKNDVWVGLIAIINTIVYLLQFLLAIQIQWTKGIYKEYKEVERKRNGSSKEEKQMPEQEPTSSKMGKRYKNSARVAWAH